MKYRKLLNKNIFISEIGFGAWGIGGATAGSTSYGETDDNTSKLALLAAYKSGVNYFDTSNVYGNGKSELLIGEVFEKYRESVVYSTKVGLLSYNKLGDYSIKSMRESLSSSLERLRTNYIDILYLHNMPIIDSSEYKQVLEFFHTLKLEGIIKAVGVSVSRPDEGIIAIDKIKPDVIQVNYNLMDYRVLDIGLADKAEKNKVSLVIRTPLSAGFLTSTIGIDDDFHNADHRSRINKEMRRTWLNMSNKMKGCLDSRINETSAIMSLRFCLSLKSVVSVIPGMLTPKHVLENVKASDFGVLSKSTLDSLEELYRNSERKLERDIKNSVKKLTDGKH
jgi:aryl-alcohol dehydrogenase-like predicted oxidoreductase